MMSKRARFVVSAFAIAVSAAVAILVFAARAGTGGNRFQRLADGSTMELRQIAFVKDFSYRHQSGSRLQRLLAPLSPILPQFIRGSLLSAGGGSMGFSTDGRTNLFVITVNRGLTARSGSTSWGPDLMRLVVSDGAGNDYDACWGASTLGMPGEVARGWQIRAFPRRSRTLDLRFVGISPSNTWNTIATFRITNPALASHPQWTPEPRPVTKTDGDLAVTLQEFQSGAPFRVAAATGDEKTEPRKTRLVFDFSQNGQATDAWRIQRLNISDATGNEWFPYLDFIKQDFNWATNGTAEFLGALWPGEEAWKLDVEFIRTTGFSSDELWESAPLTIPTFGVNTNLNARFEKDGVTVELVGLAAPDTDQADPFKWIAKYWGDEDKTKIISLAVKISPELEKRRLSLVQAMDQNGNGAKLLEHRSDDNPNQALILKVADGAQQLRFTFALQRSRFAQFLAHPEFVPTNRTNHSASK